MLLAAFYSIGHRVSGGKSALLHRLGQQPQWYLSRRAAAGRAQLVAKRGGIWAHAASAGTGTDP